MPVAVAKRPMTVQQIATVVKQLSLPDQRQLLDLVPNLRWVAQKRPVRTAEEIEASVVAVRAELMSALNYQPVSRDAPFLGGLTLGEYLALPDSEQALVWDEAAEIDWDDLEEVEVSPDALLARSSYSTAYNAGLAQKRFGLRSYKKSQRG